MQAVVAAPNSKYNYKEPHEVVAWLYRDFAWEAMMEDTPWENDLLINQPAEILSLYFTHDIVALLLKDRACVHRTKEICNLDFDPIFDTQDPGAYSLQISPADQSGTVKVQFIYPGGNQEKIQLTYQVVKTNNGWRIQNIKYRNGSSLRQILKGKP
jgi:hypothetical protein